MTRIEVTLRILERMMSDPALTQAALHVSQSANLDVEDVLAEWARKQADALIEELNGTGGLE